jgi:hypothetical protein
MGVLYPFTVRAPGSAGHNRTIGATPESMAEAIGSAIDDDRSPARRAWSAGHRVGLLLDEGTRPA